MRVLLCFWMLFPLLVSAQNATRVLYQFTHIKDSTPLRVDKDEMALDFTAKGSMYFSKTKYVFDSTLAAQEDPTELLKQIPPFLSQRIFTQFSKPRMIVLQNLTLDTIAIEDTSGSIKWKLLKEQKTIAGFACKAATGVFKGRSYKAWYCPDIPTAAGPWKLHGLPGLIMEATDATQSVKFTFLGIRNLSNGGLVKLPAKTQNLTLEQYEKMLDDIAADPQGHATRSVEQIIPPSPDYQAKATVVVRGADGKELPPEKNRYKPSNSLELIAN